MYTTVSTVLFFRFDQINRDEIDKCIEYAQKIQPDLRFLYLSSNSDFEEFVKLTKDDGGVVDTDGVLSAYFYHGYTCDYNNWLENGQMIITNDMGYFDTDGGRTIRDRPTDGLILDKFLENGKTYMKTHCI